MPISRRIKTALGRVIVLMIRLITKSGILPQILFGVYKMMISSLLSMVLPALVPVMADGARGLFAKFSGGAGGQPQNVAERIQLMQAQNERIDQPSGEVSQWVANTRGIFRYAVISGIWGLTALAMFTNTAEAYTLVLLDMSGASMSFIIGERMYLGIKK